MKVFIQNIFAVFILLISAQVFADGDCSNVKKFLRDPVPSQKYTLDYVADYKIKNPESQKFIVQEKAFFFIDCGYVYRENIETQKIKFLGLSKATSIISFKNYVLAIDKNYKADLIVDAVGKSDVIKLDGDYVEGVAVDDTLILLNKDNLVTVFESARKSYDITYVYLYDNKGNITTMIPILSDAFKSSFKKTKLTKVSSINKKNTTDPVFIFTDRGRISYSAAKDGKLL